MFDLKNGFYITDVEKQDYIKKKKKNYDVYFMLFFKIIKVVVQNL